jgi:hypothetical protein
MGLFFGVGQILERVKAIHKTINLSFVNQLDDHLSTGMKPFKFCCIIDIIIENNVVLKRDFRLGVVTGLDLASYWKFDRILGNFRINVL